MTLGIVAFVAALLLSVMLHELGHFLTARRFGMKATQFFVGFGPTLWSVRRGETEYGVKAIPAGGFVKIVGMTALEDVDESDLPRAFYRQPWWQRSIVLSAGSLVHFFIGIVLLLGVLGFEGRLIATTSVARIVPCISTSGTCAPGQAASPAQQAGLKPGDRIMALDGVPVSGWAALTKRIRSTQIGRTLDLTVQRGGQVLHVRPTPVATTRPSAADPRRTETVPVIGVEPATKRQSYGVLGTVRAAGSAFWQSTTGTLKAIGSIPANVPKLLHTDRPREATGLLGPVGAARVSGQALKAGGVAEFVGLVAALNISVGLFNLLPLLPLDGGHLAICWFETARSAIARRRGRPDPGRVDLLKLMPAAYFVVAVFIGLSLLLLVNDVINPIKSPF